MPDKDVFEEEDCHIACAKRLVAILQVLVCQTNGSEYSVPRALTASNCPITRSWQSLFEAAVCPTAYYHLDTNFASSRAKLELASVFLLNIFQTVIEFVHPSLLFSQCRVYFPSMPSSRSISTHKDTCHCRTLSMARSIPIGVGFFLSCSTFLLFEALYQAYIIGYRSCTVFPLLVKLSLLAVYLLHPDIFSLTCSSAHAKTFIQTPLMRESRDCHGLIRHHKRSRRSCYEWSGCGK